MKNGEADPLHLIVGAVILLIAMVVIIIIFRGLFSKEANVTSTNIIKVGADSDNDGVSDLLDFCPYDSGFQKRNDPGSDACNKDAAHPK